MSSFRLSTAVGELGGRHLVLREAVSELFQIDVMVRVGDANLDLSRAVARRRRSRSPTKTAAGAPSGDGSASCRAWSSRRACAEKVGVKA